MIGFTSDYIHDGKKFKVLQIDSNREVTETIKGKKGLKRYGMMSAKTTGLGAIGVPSLLYWTDRPTVKTSAPNPTA